MLRAHHRYPSRGTSATMARTRAQDGPMALPLPREDPRGPKSRLQSGQFAPGAKPIQDLVGTGIRELFTSLLDIPTALRLGDNSGRPRYFGTVTPMPQVWQSPSEINSDDSVRAGVINAGNAPQAENKTTSQGPPRIARSLPSRPR